jgi:perosamine synthetase
VFVDIDPRTLNLDPARIEALITSRTRAIVAVHTFGCPADMEKILSIARNHGLFVIEDACEALGAEYQGRKVGGLGDAGVFGFYPNKQITTGEGGMVVTHSKEIAATVKALRNQGRRDSQDWFQHTELGYNYRISEMNCALGVAQLKRIDQILQRREEVAALYAQKLCGVKELTLPNRGDADCKISWFVYVVRLGEGFSEADRDQIISQMGRRGIGLGRYFAPIHLQPIYKGGGARTAALPVTESIAPRCLALPFFNRIREEEIEEVCETLEKLLTEAGNRATSGSAGSV